MLHRARERRGFTLVELMIIVVILAILAVVGVASYQKYMHKARTQEAFGVLGDIKVKQAQYMASYGTYVSTSDDPTVLGGADYFPTFPHNQEGENAGESAPWNVDCNTEPADTPGGRFCLLGVRPTGEVVFQYKTIGFDPSGQLGNPTPTPPDEAIPTTAWQEAGSPRWWYAAARANFYGGAARGSARDSDKVYVLLTSILREPIVKDEQQPTFAF